MFGVIVAIAAVLTGSQPAFSGSTDRQGEVLFERYCVVCHGIGGTGGRGPSLRRARLLHAPDDVALRSVIQKGIPPEMPGHITFSDEEVAAVADYVRSVGKVDTQEISGDPAHGARVFAASGCPGCHIFGGAGTGYGPELTGLGERRSSEYVREAILKPAAGLPADFLMVRAVSPKGVVEGIRVNEDTFSIQIKDARGQFHSFRKSDLKALERLRGKTPMPSFEGVLTSADLQDLVAYLESPRDGS